MKKLVQKIKTKLQSVVRFVQINIWIQKVLIKAIKWFYAIRLINSIYNRMTSLIGAYLMASIINTVLKNLESPELIFDLIKFYLVAYLINTIISRILNSIYWTNRYLKETFKLEYYIDTLLLNKLDALNWEHIENPETEKNINMAFNRSKQYINSLSEVHIDLISIFFALMFAILTTNIQWYIYLLIMIKELPSIILQFKWNLKSYKGNDEMLPKFIQQEHLIGYFRTFTTLLEIKLTKAKVVLQEKLKKIHNTIYSKFTQINKKYLPYEITLEIYEAIINAGINFYFIWEIIYKGLELGTFQYITTAISKIGGYIYQLLSKSSTSVEQYRYIKFAYNFLTQENTTVFGQESIGERVNTIEFNNVWFKYPGSSVFSLKNVSVKITPQDTIALVGENGAGKTTFLKLLTRTYAPTKGQILINGQNIKNLSKDSLYGALALITQDFARYNALTVKENITIYGNKTKTTTKEVQRAAELAGAKDFIEKLTNKYDTLLTKKLEGGTELSTGQWQRLAVARQFYADRPLIILDEPTSAIDPIAEAKIFDNLYYHVKNKTVIVVSHRYNTVKAAKKILVFKEGEIIESGNHKELLDKKGYYAKAYEVQNEEKKL